MKWAVAAFALCAAAATGQGFPSRPLTLTVGFAAGGGVDITARLIGAKLGEILGQPVLVENRPGGGSYIATERVARAAPDGYTLLVTPPVLTVNAALHKQPAFDPRELAPVTMISSSPNILVVNASSPVKDVQGLVALARTKPGARNFSSAGNGTTGHLCGELFKLRTGTDIVHVPYNGNAPALAALLAGDVDFSFAPTPAVLSYVKAGRLRALATTSDHRSTVIPDVPTMKEAGVDGVDVGVWYGIFAPAGTPQEIVSQLSAAFRRVVQDSELRQRLLDHGEEPVASSPEVFGQHLRDEIAKWRELLKASGLHTD